MKPARLALIGTLPLSLVAASVAANAPTGPVTASAPAAPQPPANLPEPFAQIPEAWRGGNNRTGRRDRRYGRA